MPAYTGIAIPASTTCSAMAADNRLPVGGTASSRPQELGVKALVPPQMLVNRMMVDDAVVEAPNLGAHFTTTAPDYGRDEKFQRHYAEAAADNDRKGLGEVCLGPTLDRVARTIINRPCALSQRQRTSTAAEVCV